MDSEAFVKWKKKRENIYLVKKKSFCVDVNTVCFLKKKWLKSIWVILPIILFLEYVTTEQLKYFLRVNDDTGEQKKKRILFKDESK